MRKTNLPYFALASIISVLVSSCKTESNEAEASIPDQSFVEEFDTIQSAYNRGWRWVNKSVPLGTSNWKQSNGPSDDMTAFSSRNSNSNAAAYADYLSTGGSNNGIISNWLVSPVITMQNGDRIIFYTKTQRDLVSDTDWGCRLQLRINAHSESIDIGDGDDHGKFTDLLIDINPFEEEFIPSQPSPAAFPGGWTRFEGSVSGLSAPTKGRFAFRYFLHGAGSQGAGNGVGLDSVAYVGKKG